MHRSLKWALLAAALLATRLAHAGILWVEECYPAAAAIQILHGKIPYRDFVFDKPPLAPLVYLLWGAYAGLPLRIAGALFVLLCCGLIYGFARELWGETEAWLAAALLAFFLTFDTPSAVLAMAPDLLMIAPHIAAMYLAWRGRTAAAGAMAAVALLLNPKGVFVLAACVLPKPRKVIPLGAGFAAVCAIGVAALAATGSFSAYWDQVWRWGSIYAGDTFLANPVSAGFTRTAAWLGFHAALTVGAILWWRREGGLCSVWLAGWIVISFASLITGLRFFPRYYFQLLPALTLVGARGIALVPRQWRPAVLALLLVPLIRFGPRYVTLAGDQLAGRRTEWADLAMSQDSEAAAGVVNKAAGAGDTLLVWGYRPDIWVETRMAAGTPFLDSQPLTGVIADRHLSDSRPSAPDLAFANRRRLAEMQPTWIVDGLGPYNPALAIAHYPDLESWLSHYRVIGRTSGAIVYQREQ